MMMKSILPVLGSKPIDRLALAVILDGEHWEPTIPMHMTHCVRDAPIPCHTPPENQAQFVGQRRGTIVAIGFLSNNRNNKPVWLMRCDCGKYTFRYIIGWARRVDVFDQCVACETTKAITNSKTSEKNRLFRKARWANTLKTEGFTESQISVIQQYSLPADDLDWLRGALASLPALQPPNT